jgi:phosphomevalonate kinase
MSKTKCVEVLAPGKVLITGGYLIIDPENSGLVLSTNTMFSCTIKATNQPDKLLVDCP